LTSGTSFSPPPAFGRFRLLHQIGAGVLGPVFRTHDPDGDRLVAVKAFTLDLTPERAQELVDELQRVVDIDLEHPNIARPLATGVEESVAYLAQEYVAGESLDAAIRQYGPAPASDAVRLITHVAEALDVAARVGVFHGVLHPRDILVTPGETHVTGLGVSMALEKIGQHGPIRRPYAAPEREAGNEWGAAADVFSLAVIAYEVLTGRRALPGTEQPLPGLADLRVKDASALRELLESAIDPEPERRPAHARDFADALGAALVDATVPTEKGDRPGISRRKPRIRVPKLPGLDDPLVPDVKSEAVPPEPPAETPRPEPVLEPEPEAAPPPSEPEIQVARVIGPEPDAIVDADPDAPSVAAIEVRPKSRPTPTPRPRRRPEVHPDPAPVVTDQPAQFEARRPEPDATLTAPAGPSLDPDPPGVVVSKPVPEPEPDPEPIVVYVAEPIAEAVVEAVAEPIESVLAAELAPVLLEFEPPIDPTPGPGSEGASARFGTVSEPEAIDVPIDLRLRPTPQPAEISMAPLFDDEMPAVDQTPAAQEPGDAFASDPAPITVPRAIDPTADRHDFQRAELSYGGEPRKPARQWGMLAIGVIAGLLVGVLGGFELASWWGAPSPAATATGVSPVSPPVQAPAMAVTESANQPAARVTEFVPAPAAQPPIVPTETRTMTPAPAPTTPVAAAPAVKPGVGSTDKPAAKPAAPSVEKPAAKSAVKADPKKTAQVPGTLVFATRPAGARVLIDGKDVGKTPFTASKVVAGAHTIEFRLTGFRPWSKSVTVGAGKLQRVTASLERDISR